MNIYCCSCYWFCWMFDTQVCNVYPWQPEPSGSLGFREPCQPHAPQWFRLLPLQPQTLPQQNWWARQFHRITQPGRFNRHLADIEWRSGGMWVQDSSMERADYTPPCTQWPCMVQN